MKALLKKWVATSGPYQAIQREVRARRELRQLAEWERAGKPAPPPHTVKQRALRELAHRYGMKTLVETGTFYGDMVEAMRADFDHIYSVELSKDLYDRARIRFASCHNVTLLHGDSAVEISGILKQLRGPALFWLDGHYSAGETARGPKETPVLEELQHILTDRDLNHVVVIDDARNFGMDPAYPSLPELVKFVLARKAASSITVQHDSIRVLPAALAASR